MKLWKVVTEDRKSITIKRRGYMKTYIVGTIVHAAPKSVGLLCFNALRGAQRCQGINGGVIIEVEPVGNISEAPRYVFAIACSHGQNISTGAWKTLERERKRIEREYPAYVGWVGDITVMPMQRTPMHTVTCNSIKVLT